MTEQVETAVVRRTITVPTSQQRAFEIFTAQWLTDVQVPVEQQLESNFSSFSAFTHLCASCWILLPGAAIAKFE